MMMDNMADKIILRTVIPEDLPVFFEQMKDEQAVHMAAFTAKDPSDRNAFDQHWQKIQADESVIIRTILYDKMVAGYVLSYETDGKPEVSYWIGQKYWGKGIATRALYLFLNDVDKRRPMYARTAKDNLASYHVLQKNGFKNITEVMGFANARGKEILELLLVLNKEE
jgi:RimJ/RimL family protein N-acetyltransferase